MGLQMNITEIIQNKIQGNILCKRDEMRYNFITRRLNEELSTTNGTIKVETILKHHQCLIENYQMAEKYYIKTQKLNDDEIEMILSISNKDATTKFLCDIMYNYVKPMLEQHNETLMGDMQEKIIDFLSYFRNCLLRYKKTIFPIAKFDILDGSEDMRLTVSLRDDILLLYEKLPSVAMRNTIDKKILRNKDEMEAYQSKLYDFVEKYEDNHHDTDLDYKKMFSEGKGLDVWDESINHFVETKNMEDFYISDKEDLDKILAVTSAKILFEKDDWYLIEITDPKDLYKLGNGSNWCFSQKTCDEESNENYFDSYSWDGVLYILLDFNQRIYNNDKIVITSPFLTKDGKFVGLMDVKTEREFDSSSYDDVPFNKRPSTFYNEGNKNLWNGDAKAVWDSFLKIFDNTEKSKIIKTMIDWGSTYFV